MGSSRRGSYSYGEGTASSPTLPIKLTLKSETK